MIAQGAPRTLRELVEATLALTCADGDVPTVRRLCFAARWAVAELSDGRAGRAFTFNGQHAVYGALDFELMRDMRRFVDMRVDEVWRDCSPRRTGWMRPWLRAGRRPALRLREACPMPPQPRLHAAWRWPWPTRCPAG